MDQSLFKFDLIAEDPTTHARAGVLHTPHGDIETPIFMPVGTKANVKGIPTETVKQLGAQIVLANTYHLSMRPGEDTIAELGGLHKFMNWHGPILTDSGGFQVFSHNDAVKLTDEGVRFIVNDYDGRHVFWTPEDNMEIAMKLGSDICMQLDQCPGYPATRAYVERAVELSSMWAERCYKAHTRDDQALFGIVQGGMHLDLRLRSLRHLEECGDFPGYGIDFVFNPGNCLLREQLNLRKADFEPEQQKMVLEAPAPDMDTTGIVPLSDQYAEQYCAIHNKDMYWTGEKVVQAQDRFHTFLAIRDGRVVGYIDVTCTFKENEPFDLLVLEEYRRMGYGRKLLAKALEANAPNAMSVLVDADNVPAIRLYASMGFAKKQNILTAHWTVPSSE